MRWPSLHLRGIGAALGDLVPVDPKHPTGQQSISIAHRTTGMDLAVRAGHAALSTLAQITHGPLPVPELHLHSAIWRGSRGIDFWSRATYIRTRLGLPAGPGLTAELNAMSNSLIAGIDLAGRILAGSTDLDHILLTGGEVFGPPAFDHLTADHGIAYGDGGSALILGRTPGLARILATASYTDPTLEQLHRGHHRFLPAGTTEPGPERIRERKHQYLATVGTHSINTRNTHGIRTATKNALADADLTPDQLAWVLLPHYGRQLLDTHCLRPLNIPAERTLHDAGNHWGHLGPNDQIVGLTHHAVHPGDHIALIGIGIGMTWTTAILRIDHIPTTLPAPPLHAPWRTRTA
ncbi:3-oxoacyl-[acyl-carrier-protein] synthase III C-terminal domain-containing protein [Amycolatopsis jejuensis]|uniref:3-oxoacyl-[acyl-carrier-protein] synthase III C-terminal domain-containing protein n=1 Tax=Amycolatopsis jejuensis TaxID=330084 RepID=UPI000525A1C4|nr:3-oxoacyl-[acyl-carrier-protein] synthase III C-terminal domain-containing protein [Amycolatopsis jejuensis]